jgi:hypothetical protein
MKNDRALAISTRIGNMIGDASMAQRRVLESPQGSLHNIAAAAKEVARRQGEMIVLHQVQAELTHFLAEGGDAPEDVLFHAALSAAMAPPASSAWDAAAFAEGQRDAIRAIIRTIPTTTA